jgi:hypothetical protein
MNTIGSGNYLVLPTPTSPITNILTETSLVRVDEGPLFVAPLFLFIIVLFLLDLFLLPKLPIVTSNNKIL